MRFQPLVAALLAGALLGSPAGAAPRPSVVIILAVDLGSGDLSCTGSGENRTPVLDTLASQGMRFTDFYAACAVCSPSRAAMLTGRFPVRAGVYSWIATSHNMHLRVEETTIAELLKDAGYDTAHVGKWHLGYDLEDGGEGSGPDPGDHGFDHWLATGNNARPSHRNPDNFVRNGRALGEVEGYSCQIVVDEALRWLDDHRDPDRPFFLNVWFHEPHMRVAAPPELKARHRDTKRPAYYGSIENMDRAVGRLLETLDAMGAADDTLVIFTSDNGSYMAGSNGPLRGRKTSLWEGGIRVPGIIRLPGRVKAGTVSPVPAGIVDILPTVCDVVGIDPPSDRTLDGVSLAPLFDGRPITRHKPLYWFYSPSRPVCVIRDGDWCLVADPDIDLPRQNFFKESFIGPVKEAKLVNFRLFNLRQDPAQEQDLADARPKRLAEMKRAMIDLHRDVVGEGYDWRRAE